MLYEEICFYSYWYDWAEGEKRTGASLVANTGLTNSDWSVAVRRL